MSTKIKVLETIRQGQIGGGESHLLSLVENLDKDKFEPIVLSFTEGPMVDKLREMGIKTEVIYTETPFDIRVWLKVKSFLLDNKIELIHAHGTRANSNVFWAAKQLNIPVIYTVHGWSFHDDQNFLVKNFRLWGERLLTRKSKVNISVSASNQLTGIKNINGFSSVVVNLQFSNIREELGVKHSEILILFLARFNHQKQPLILIKAFAKAHELNPNLKLLLVGDGEQKSEALQLVKTLGLSENILFQSFRQDVPDVLAAADIFVLPSLWEGLPIGLLEAMAMGKAIIATNVDGTSEVIHDGTNGLLIAVDELENNLVDSILKLSADKELQNVLGRNARQTISLKYSAATMTRQIEDVYLKII
jgi:glycosyltransferase involved in cell wall biosynthesis